MESAAPVAGLAECIRRGIRKEARVLTERELLSCTPLGVVNDVLVPSLEEVGALYEKGTLFLPQLIASAETAKEAFAVVGSRMERGSVQKGTVVLATVRGDAHDIGKNIVKVVLESHGFRVIDLGKDTPVEAVVEAALHEHTLAVGLSALMTTTVPSMEQTIAALHAAGCRAPVFVGGAILTEEIALTIGADRYTANGLEFAKALDEMLAK